MRQKGFGTFAPLNSSTRWPGGYFAVRREAGALEKAIPYHIAWVRRFFARFPGRSRRSPGRTEIERFLAEMNQKGVSTTAIWPRPGPRRKSMMSSSRERHRPSRAQSIL
jgi:hypothetical protein